MEVGILTYVNLLFLNALFPIMIALDGIVKVFKELSANKKSPSIVAEDCMFTDVKLLFWNTASPMEVIVDGICNCVKLLIEQEYCPKDTMLELDKSR